MEYINYICWVVLFPMCSRPSESVVVRHLHEIWPVWFFFFNYNYSNCGYLQHMI